MKNLIFITAMLSLNAYAIEVDFDTEEFALLYVNSQQRTDDISTFIIGDNVYVNKDKFFTTIKLSKETNNNVITGWVFNKENKFKIDLNDNDSTFTYEEEYYFNLTEFAKETGIELEWTNRRSEIKLRSNDMFPFEIERYLSKAKSKKSSLQGEKPLPDNYEWYTKPIANISSTLNYRDEATLNHNGYLALDLLKHSTQARFSVNDDEFRIQELSIAKRSRHKEDRLLGGIATSYEIGEISNNSLNSFTRNQRGLGFSFRKGRETLSGVHTSKHIYGIHIPNKTVEVYLNELLIGKTVTDDEGRYDFYNLPIGTGLTEITLKLYGLNGEIITKTEQLKVTRDNISAGEINYAFSFLDEKNSLINSDSLEEGSTIGNAEITYGLSESSTFTTGISSLLSETDEMFITNKLSQSFGDNSFNLSSITDGNDFNFLIEGSGKLLGHSYNARISENNFNTESIAPNTEKSSQRYSVYNSLNTPFFRNINYRAEYSNQSGVTTKGLSFNLSVDNIFAGYGALLSNDELTHKVTLSTNVLGVHLYANHSFSDLNQQTNIQLSKTFDGYNANLNANFNDNSNSYNFSLTKDTKRHQFTIGAGYSNDLTFNFKYSTNLFWEENLNRYELNRQTLSNTGSIKAFAYEDTNGNGKKDANEPTISGVKFLNKELWRDIKTSANGIAILPGTSTTYTQKIKVDEKTIEDFTLRPPKPQVVITHAGSNTLVEFPFKPQHSVDGVILVKDGKPLKYAKISLKHAFGEIIQTHTDNEGYFYLEGALRGQHTLTIVESEQEPNLANKVIHTFTTTKDIEDLELGNITITEEHEHHIFFEHNSSYLNKQSKDSLNNIVSSLDSAERIIIIGHSSNSGTKEYNLWLSKRRAHRIKDFLINKLPKDGPIIEAYGTGINTNTSNEDKLKTRADITIKY